MNHFHNEIISDPLTDAVVEVASLVMARVRSELRRGPDDNLSFPQTRALAFVKKQPGASVSDVGEFMGVGIPTASKVVDELAQRGLLERNASSEDRRRVELRLTEDGQAALLEAVRPALASIAVQLEPLSKEERTRIAEALEMLRPLVERCEAMK